jgi:hypothetical protein
MSRPPHFPRSGGILLALAIVTGAVVGTLKLQPSIGFLAGLGAGLVLLALVWLIDRRRPGI